VGATVYLPFHYSPAPGPAPVAGGLGIGSDASYTALWAEARGKVVYWILRP
jgi:hypothetical protein